MIWLAFSIWLAGSARAFDHFSTAWSTYVGGANDDDRVSAVAIDNSSNVYLGGTCHSEAIQDNMGHPVSLDRPGFVAKVSPNGALLWARDFADYVYRNDEILALAIGPSRVFAAGYMRSNSANTDNYAFIAALDTSDGSVIWHDKSIGNHEYEGGTNQFTAVAVASDGTVYAAGRTSLSNQICNVSGNQVGGITYGTNLSGGTDAFIVKYSTSGTPLWKRYLGGANDDSANAVAIGPDGHVYVAGKTFSPNWVSLANSGTANAGNAAGFLVKLTASGAHVWSSYLNGSNGDEVTAMRAQNAATPAGTVLFLGGATASADFLPSALDSLGTAYAGGTDGFVARVTDTNTAFRVDWRRFTGGASADRISSLDLLADGRLIAGGTTASGGWLTLTDGSQAHHGMQDGFITLLNSTNGVLSWASYIGGSGNDQIHALAASADTFITAGHTFSDNWIGGGFWTEWDKSDLWGDFHYGFAVKWQPGGAIPPTLIAHPADRTVQEGDAVTFTVAATGTAPLFYRWYRDSEPLAGATHSNLTFTAAYADDGAAYSCLVSNVAGTATSGGATLTVTPMGTLTVTLTPPDAVTLGASWRFDDSAWLPSGLTTNLPAGAYAISFTNLPGWLTPAPLAAVPVPHAATATLDAAYTPILPEAQRGITGTNVTLTVTAPAGLSSWTLTEILSEGLTPTNITSGGAWDSGARTLTFTGPEATTQALAYTVSSATSGVYTVTGTIKPEFASPVPVTGDTSILNAKIIRTITGTSVTITILDPTPSIVWTVTEQIPAELTASTPVYSSGMAMLFPPNITWMLNGPGTLSYTVSGDPGTYMISASATCAGQPEPILGDTVLTIPGEEPPPPPDIPPPNILAFTPAPAGNAFMLTFTSVVDQAYSILTNAVLDDPDGWGVYLEPVVGGDGTTQQEVEIPADTPRLFYRVRRIEHHP